MYCDDDDDDDDDIDVTEDRDGSETVGGDDDDADFGDGHGDDDDVGDGDDVVREKRAARAIALRKRSTVRVKCGDDVDDDDDDRDDDDAAEMKRRSAGAHKKVTKRDPDVDVGGDDRVERGTVKDTPRASKGVKRGADDGDEDVRDQTVPRHSKKKPRRDANAKSETCQLPRATKSRTTVGKEENDDDDADADVVTVKSASRPTKKLKHGVADDYDDDDNLVGKRASRTSLSTTRIAEDVDDIRTAGGGASRTRGPAKPDEVHGIDGDGGAKGTLARLCDRESRAWPAKSSVVPNATQRSDARRSKRANVC